ALMVVAPVQRGRRRSGSRQPHRARQMAVEIEPVTVLIATSQEDDRRALRAMLAAAGYRVVEAESTAEALRQEDCAAVLLDASLTDAGCLERTLRIERQQQTSAAPIIFLAPATMDPGLISKGYAAGVADYLFRPLSPHVVRAKVGVFARLYRQCRRLEQQRAL